MRLIRTVPFFATTLFMADSVVVVPQGHITFHKDDPSPAGRPGFYFHCHLSDTVADFFVVDPLCMPSLEMCDEGNDAGRACVEFGDVEQESSWATDHMPITIVRAGDTLRIRLDSGEDLALAEYRRRHELTTLDLALVSGEVIKLDVAAFKAPEYGCRICWHVACFYQKLRLTFYPGKGIQWFYKKKDVFTTWSEELGLGPAAVRLSSTYTNHMCPEGRRVLPWAGINTTSLVANLGRLVFADPRMGGGAVGEPGRLACMQFLRSLLTYVPDAFTLPLRFDNEVVNLQGMPVGQCGFNLNVVDGVVELFQLQYVLDCGRMDLGFVSVTQSLVDRGRATVDDMMSLLMPDHSHTKDRSYRLCLFKQVVWSVGSAIDLVLASSLGVVVGPPVDHEPDAVPIYRPGDAGYVSRELLKYWKAGNTLFQDSQNLSLASDMTKIGDLSLLNTCLVDPVTGTAFWAAPQVPKEFYSTADLEGPQAKVEAGLAWDIRASSLLRKRAGEANVPSLSVRKKRRAKSFSQTLMLDNVLELHTRAGLEQYSVNPVADQAFCKHKVFIGVILPNKSGFPLGRLSDLPGRLTGYFGGPQ